MNTTTQPPTIKIHTSLTKDLIFKSGDSYTQNVYGEFACFIGWADRIDNESKQHTVIRFESEPFVLHEVKDVHAMWLDFDRKASEYVIEHEERFKPIATIIDVVKL